MQFFSGFSGRVKALTTVLLVTLGTAASGAVGAEEYASTGYFETVYAPYALGQAGPEVSVVYADRTEPTGPVVRTDTVRFKAGGFIQNYGQTEYKLTVAAGKEFTYSWTASAPIYFELHGHSMVDEKTPGDALMYAHETAEAGHGKISVPLEGWHGWYFVNDSFDEDVEIELTLWGDYELAPGVINTRK